MLVGDDPTFGTDIFGYSPLVTNLAFSSYALMMMGRIQEARERLGRAFRFGGAVSLETQTWLGYWHINLAVVMGELDDARRIARRCVELAERSGSRFDAVGAQIHAAKVELALGHAREAAGLMEGALTASAESGTAKDLVFTNLSILAAACCGAGELARARAVSDEAIEKCQVEGAVAARAQCLIVRAAVVAHDPGADRARACADIDAAEELVGQTGARLLLPMIHEARGLLTSGATREAHLREARHLLAEMGAGGYAERPIFAADHDD